MFREQHERPSVVPCKPEPVDESGIPSLRSAHQAAGAVNPKLPTDDECAQHVDERLVATALTQGEHHHLAASECGSFHREGSVRDPPLCESQHPSESLGAHGIVHRRWVEAARRATQPDPLEHAAGRSAVACSRAPLSSLHVCTGTMASSILRALAAGSVSLAPTRRAASRIAPLSSQRSRNSATTWIGIRAPADRLGEGDGRGSPPTSPVTDGPRTVMRQ